MARDVKSYANEAHFMAEFAPLYRARGGGVAKVVAVENHYDEKAPLESGFVTLSAFLIGYEQHAFQTFDQVRGSLLQVGEGKEGGKERKTDNYICTFSFAKYVLGAQIFQVASLLTTD